MKKFIYTNKAPKPLGPYSQAVKSGRFLFCSGQIGIDPKTNKLVEGGIEKETEQDKQSRFPIYQPVQTLKFPVLRR